MEDNKSNSVPMTWFWVGLAGSVLLELIFRKSHWVARIPSVVQLLIVGLVGVTILKRFLLNQALIQKKNGPFVRIYLNAVLMLGAVAIGIATIEFLKS